jgi:SAM-dependent methyltransferase
MRSALASFGMAHTDIIGFLNVGLMHIISAKQLQLLLQHSFQVEKPIDVEAFKSVNMKEFIDSRNGVILNGAFSNTARQSGSSATAVMKNKRHMETALPAALNHSKTKKVSKSTQTQLAGSLLGVQPISDSEDDDESDLAFGDKASQAQHLLNLNAILNQNDEPSTNTTHQPHQYSQNSSNSNSNLNSKSIFSRLPQSTTSTFSDILFDGSKDPTSFTSSLPNYASQSYQQVFFDDFNTSSMDNFSTAQLAPIKFGSMLDVGAGSGRMAELLTPIFDSIECTEVSSEMVKAIEKKGFKAYLNDNLDDLDKSKKYDVICLFNLIDRCDEPINLMYQLHKRLQPLLTARRASLMRQMKQTVTTIFDTIDGTTTTLNVAAAQEKSGEKYENFNGRVVIAVPLPLRPSVEMTLNDNTRTWRKPLQDIAQTKCWCCTSYEESLQHLIVNIIEPCGYDVLSFTRLPDLSEGNQYATHFVLEDIVLVCAPKPEWAL